MSFQTPTTLRAAQTIGLTTISVLTGASLSFSALVIPRILDSPTPLLLRQWRDNFELGKATIPLGTGLSSAIFFYLSYVSRNASMPLTSDANLKMASYLTSGLLALAIVPYTQLLMSSTNNKLLAKVEETKFLSFKDEVPGPGLNEESAHALVDHWASLNLGRTVLLAMSAVMATWTALE